eukprot:g25117.t1
MVILANAIFIGVVTDVSMRNASLQPPIGDPAWFQMANRIFVGVFVAEVLLRIVAKRIDFVLGIDWKWNIFDLCLAGAPVRAGCVALWGNHCGTLFCWAVY